MKPVLCPHCGNTAFKHEPTLMGEGWRCCRCGCFTVPRAELCKHVPSGGLDLLWATIQQERELTGKKCPVCGRAMTVFQINHRGELQEAEVCASCQVFCFTPETFQAFSSCFGIPAQSDPLSTNRQLALAGLEMVTEQAHTPSFSSHNYPEEWWKVIPASLGIPVQLKEDGSERFPWITSVLSALVVLAWVFTLPDIAYYAENWGFIAAKSWQHGGLTFFTPVFLHENWLHLVVNLYFFIVFGKDVESALGYWRYGLLLVCAQLSCCFCHTLFAIGQSTPMVGASGMVWGVVSYFGLRYPLKQIGIRIRGRWLALPSILFVALWVGIEFLGCMAQASFEVVKVGYLGHLGGILAGVIFFIVTRPKPASNNWIAS